MSTNQVSDPLDAAELARRFTRFTLLMYDTGVPEEQLEGEVFPHLSPDVVFVDPAVHTRGRDVFEVGRLGFACVSRFDYTILQLCVQMNEHGDGGRVLVDGVMNLRPLVIYTYPLRAPLVYDFVLTEGGRSFLVTRQEELWSLGDLLQNLPVAGPVFETLRRASGHFFTALFWLGCLLRGRQSRPWPLRLRRGR